MGSDVNLTTPVPCGSYHAATVECSKGNINIWEDPYFIGAVVCFCLGGLLFLLGFGRLIWYLAQPKETNRAHFPYVIRYTDPYYAVWADQQLHTAPPVDIDTVGYRS